uniref:RBR-type E3 ubiquitin transferase n=1 Tax=Aegilops tauschii TaxID=37682 RepID=M8CKD4_AEGTA
MALRGREEGGEPDLPDEQLRSNDQLQQDEMLALEAIYGDKIRIFGEKAIPRSFQILVYCEIPDGISVYVEPFQGDDDDDTKSQFPENFSIEHLAPLSLTCLMPPSYPSHHPPYFTLGVQWLDNVKVSSLCHMLDLIWAQQPEQEVVYEWVHWLQSSVLSHLGFDNGIVIRQPHSALPCQHYFCQRCMETYSRIHLKEGTVLKLVCPDDKCGGIIPPNLLKRLLGDADFEWWERLVLQKALDSMADVAYCPRCGIACLGDEDNALCSNCLLNFCTRCRNLSHTGRSCIVLTPEEKLLTLQERAKVRRLSKGEVGMIISMANEIFSIKEVLRSSIPCPHCGIAITRVSGCNHMLCRKCGKQFDYDLAGRHNVRAVDFIKDVEVQKEARARLSASFKQHPCPKCHQPHHKMGNNNHILCLACQVHYCAPCRKVVRKSSEHYGPRGCKHHTVDPVIAQTRTKNNDDSGSELV